MITYRVFIVFGGREQLLTIRAERQAPDETGHHVFYDDRDEAIAWVPDEIVIQIQEV